MSSESVSTESTFQLKKGKLATLTPEEKHQRHVEQMKQWYEKNSDYMLQYRKNYYEKNREKLIKQSAECRKRRKAKIMEQRLKEQAEMCKTGIKYT